MLKKPTKRALGRNKTEVTTSEGVLVLVSYQTPVAAKFANGEIWVTSIKYSQTTTKHINSWTNYASAVSVKQQCLDRLLREE